MRHKLSASAVAGILTAIVLGGSGCSATAVTDPGPGKRVETSLARDVYLPGDLVSVSVRNTTGLTLSYPLAFCKIELERQENAEWVTVASPEGCRLALAFMAPQRTVVQDYRLPAGLAAGTYRLTMASPTPERATTPEPRLTTPAFEVGSGAL